MSEWNEGFPDKRGMYECLVDGKETYLVHHECMNNGKHWWSDTRGYDVVGCDIKYKGKALTAEKIKIKK